MVDFNNEATIGVPAIDVERISILQRRYDVIDAFEDYKKKKLMGANITLFIVRARLLSFFLELQAMLKRRLSLEEYNKLNNLCIIQKDITELEFLEALELINKQLDIIQLTKIDNKKVYDGTNVEAENYEKGF